MDSLPVVILSEILSYLSINVIVQCTTLNKKFYRTAKKKIIDLYKKWSSKMKIELKRVSCFEQIYSLLSSPKIFQLDHGAPLPKISDSFCHGGFGEEDDSRFNDDTNFLIGCLRQKRFEKFRKHWKTLPKAKIAFACGYYGISIDGGFVEEVGMVLGGHISEVSIPTPSHLTAAIYGGNRKFIDKYITHVQPNSILDIILHVDDDETLLKIIDKITFERLFFTNCPRCIRVIIKNNRLLLNWILSDQIFVIGADHLMLIIEQLKLIGYDADPIIERSKSYSVSRCVLQEKFAQRNIEDIIKDVKNACTGDAGMPADINLIPEEERYSLWCLAMRCATRSIADEIYFF